MINFWKVLIFDPLKLILMVKLILVSNIEGGGLNVGIRNLRVPQSINREKFNSQFPFYYKQDPHWYQLLNYAVENSAYTGCPLPSKHLDTDAD